MKHDFRFHHHYQYYYYHCYWHGSIVFIMWARLLTLSPSWKVILSEEFAQGPHIGVIHKVRSRERGSKKVWQFPSEGGVKIMWHKTFKNFYHTYETWNWKWCLTFFCDGCILTEDVTSIIVVIMQHGVLNLSSLSTCQILIFLHFFAFLGLDLLQNQYNTRECHNVIIGSLGF